MSYAEFIAGICNVINNAKPYSRSGCPTLFLRRKDVIKELGRSGRPRAAIELMLRGFTVTPHKLKEEGRVIWNSKQSSRAYRRGFFSFPHETGTHLAFSRSMAMESLLQLVNGACYGKMPQEWLNQEIKGGLDKLSTAAGEWFERRVNSNLETLGYCGGRAKRRIGRGEKVLEIPAEVGELDFLGWHDENRELLLVESKMTNSGLEARFWRDDLSAFTRGRSSYEAKFKKKISWVEENKERVLKALGLEGAFSFSARMVTLYPCIAAEFIDSFPCTSLAEMMLETKQ